MTDTTFETFGLSPELNRALDDMKFSIPLAHSGGNHSTFDGKPGFNWLGTDRNRENRRVCLTDCP